MAKSARATGPVDSVADLTVEVVRNAAELLAEIEQEPPRTRAGRGLAARAFATTMCRVVAHLTDLEQATLALADEHLATLPGAQAQVLTQRRKAWNSAVDALSDATSIADGVRMSYSTAKNAGPPAPTLKNLLALRDRLAEALPLVEPPAVDIDLDGLSRLRGKGTRESKVPAVVPMEQPELSTPSDLHRRQPWWTAANL